MHGTIVPTPVNGHAVTTPTRDVLAWVRAQGWSPVPLSAPVLGDKNSGKNPQGGKDWPEQARTGQYRDFDFPPGSNVGVCTGLALNGGGYLAVIDPDGVDGVANWNALCAAHSYTPNTFVVQSGSGTGLHVYYRTPYPVSGGDLAPKINTRGHRQQVVSPGCMHYSGGTYTPLCGDPQALEPMPDWMLALLRERAETTPAIQWDGPAITLTPEMCLASSQEIVRALATGLPQAQAGDRHAYGLDITGALIAEFTPGLTDASVLAAIGPTFPDMDEARKRGLIRALKGARRMFRMSYAEWQSLATAAVIAPAAPPAPVKTKITMDDCKHQAQKLGKRSGPAADAKRIWRKLAWEEPIETADVPEACALVAHAYPDVTAEALSALIPSAVASADFVAQCLAAAHVPCDQPGAGWNTAGLLRGDEGKILATSANVYTLVMHNLWQGLRRNALGYVAEGSRLPWRNTDGRWVPLEDADFKDCEKWLQDTFKLPAAPGVRDAIWAVCEKNTVFPVRDMLLALPAWDGCARVETVLIKYLGAEDTPLTRDISSKWMVSCVARALSPGCKVDTKLVLIGAQGQKKTSFFEMISFGFYTTAKGATTSDKDVKSRKHRAWIVEDADMASHSRKDVNEEKSDLSTRIDIWRRPYGTVDQEHPRAYVEVGTENPAADLALLRDQTGARRYWLVETHGKADLEALSVELHQLWAEVLHLYRSGAQWWFDETPEALVELHETYRDKFNHEWCVQVIAESVQTPEGVLIVVQNPHKEGTAYAATCARLAGQVTPGGLLLWVTAEQVTMLVSGLTGEKCTTKAACGLLKAAGVRAAPQIRTRGREYGQRRWILR